MMAAFYDVGTVWQVILLVFSLLTIITLTGAFIFGFRNRNNIRKCLITGVIFLPNSVLYVMIQLESRITGSDRFLGLPYVLVFVVTILSFGYALWSILHETGIRKSINSTSIKEAFDNLPTGVCFFNESGLAVLCNRAMHRFSYAVCGKDIQYITDLQDCLEDSFIPIDGIVKDGKIFTTTDGKAWQLEKRAVADEKGVYTQFIALDVSDLQRNRMELIEENAHLHRVQADLKRLSANVVAVTREEEILNTKMRVHDEMGRCLVEARKYLSGGNKSIPESVVYSWHRAVSMLKYNNDADEDDMFSQIRRTCEAIKLDYKQMGMIPKEDSVAYILACAVRECVTNAVRYAEASELYARFTEDQDTASVEVTNNGRRPDSEIVEGGGLSTLRRRVEYAGGSMNVQSFPFFKLTVTVPKGREV